MAIGSCGDAASTSNAASLLMLRKTLELQRQGVEQLLPQPQATGDSVQISDQAMQRYQAAADPAA